MRDTRPDIGVIIAMKEKMSFKKKLENYWFYYKIHTIAAVFILVLVIGFIHEQVSKPKYDYHIGIIDTQGFDQDSLDSLQAEFEACAADRNGDGKIQIQLLTYAVDESESANPQQVMATQTQLFGDVELGTSVIFIYSDAIYESFKDEGLFPADESRRLAIDDSVREIPERFKGMSITLMDVDQAADKEGYYEDSEKLLNKFMNE